MILAFARVSPVPLVIALVRVEPHDRLGHPQAIGADLLVAAPAVQDLLHPRFAIVELVEGNQVVEVVVF